MPHPRPQRPRSLAESPGYLSKQQGKPERTTKTQVKSREGVSSWKIPSVGENVKSRPLPVMQVNPTEKDVARNVMISTFERRFFREFSQDYWRYDGTLENVLINYSDPVVKRQFRSTCDKVLHVTDKEGLDFLRQVISLSARYIRVNFPPEFLDGKNDEDIENLADIEMI